ncbi:class I SAM-dependent methyltransferase [Chloroflexus aggregans]|uniref:Methyltransferase type 11 n=1 Tax=Chloroflexus aggregans (strain MD-66 / DSM 9485) TaxID=326427 RepID=B8GD49_CHLAD|nr:class I SAM-dependent methyltransferase [Chloroflexus aggregans]ACL25116.1 Methyltransferase type 11 [Chloroflexus aggregans DSM 9485]
MLNPVLDRLSTTPTLWNRLRWLVEAGFTGEHLAIARELRPWRGDQRWFLDLGCGTGEFAGDFPARRYVGIDPSLTYLRFAVQHRPGHYLAANGVALPFADQTFDAGLILGVLHHLPDATARTVIHEVYRVMRPGATILVMEDTPPPANENPLGHLMHALDRGGYIRFEADYQAIFGDGFDIVRNYHLRSGICDYAVFVLRRRPS